MNLFHVCFVYLLNVSVKAYKVEILNTASEASSLKGWNKATYINGAKVENTTIHAGWDEVSVFYENSTPRGFEICPDTKEEKSQNVQSWLRSPNFNVTGVSRIYVDLHFWMRECKDLKDTICRETFKLYYRLNTESQDVFDQVELNEDEFVKVDTVAAEVRFNNAPETQKKMNHETVSIALPQTPVHRGVYIAIVDEGACISLVSTKVYYIVCPTVTKQLAHFDATHTGQHDTSLVEVKGKCVANSTPFNDPALPSSGPLYRCTSSGDWNVQTGMCQCVSGFQPNLNLSECLPCDLGHFKPSIGNSRCQPCPSHSYTLHSAATQCQCGTNWRKVSDKYREDFKCELCSKLPSSPTQLSVEHNSSNPGSISLSWGKPLSYGRCQRVTYCILCQTCRRNISSSFALHSLNSTSNNTNQSCSISSKSFCNNLNFQTSLCFDKLHQPLTITGLQGFTSFTFTVVSINGVTLDRFPNATEYLLNRVRKHTIDDVIKSQLDSLVQSSGTSLIFSTRETLPSAVSDVIITSNYTTMAEVKWGQPVRPNGLNLQYEVWWWTGVGLGESPHLTADYLHEIGSKNITVVTNNLVMEELKPNTKYLLTLRPLNSAGYGDFFPPLLFSTLKQEEVDPIKSNSSPSPLSSHVYLISAAGIFVILVTTLIVLWFKCSGTSERKKKSDQQFAIHKHKEQVVPSGGGTINTDVPDQRTYVDPFSLGPMLPHEFSCETEPHLVAINKVIGCGEFGEVYQGILTKLCAYNRRYITVQYCDVGESKIVNVAVKQLHDQCESHEQLDFLREAMALERFKHPNIVKLEAVVMRSRPFMIVTELMDHGCLEAFLRAHRQAHKAFPPDVLVRMLLGVARGMAYLSSLCYVHRDLAARNVLINSDLVCKVADFGMTRHMEEQESNGLFVPHLHDPWG